MKKSIQRLLYNCIDNVIPIEFLLTEETPAANLRQYGTLMKERVSLGHACNENKELDTIMCARKSEYYSNICNSQMGNMYPKKRTKL